MKEIKIPAPAKINLALDIQDKRPDGYHNVEMIMQSIGLADVITIKKSDEGIKVTTSNDRLSGGKSNLAYQAAELILSETGVKSGVEIDIKKNIPLSAGLAGGSTDAAAVLKGINKLYQSGLTQVQLANLAARIGSDVPFCLRGGTAYAHGRGELIKQLPDIKKIYLVLVKPPVSVSTARIYQEYDRILPERKSSIDKFHVLLKEGKDIKWNEGWYNILEPVTTTIVPDIIKIKNLLLKKGAIFSLMSGSGPTVFGIVDSWDLAVNIARSWPRSKDFIIPTYSTRQDFNELWSIYDIEI